MVWFVAVGVMDSFRAAVDRSYDGPNNETEAMETRKFVFFVGHNHSNGLNFFKIEVLPVHSERMRFPCAIFSFDV